jgi:predicted RNA-binding protein
MDEIEAGFKKLEQKIEEMQEKGDSLSQEVRDHESDLLTRMAKSVVPIVKVVGLNMLKKGKQDTKGEIYDPAYFPGKMIILGKAVKPAASRPDNPQMPVTDQFCVLSEEGKFFELMYSFDGFLTDSYLNPINAKTAIENYGYDIMFMLYRAMHDYLKGEEALVEALEKVLGYIYSRNS